MFNKISKSILELLRQPKGARPSAEYRAALSELDVKAAEAALAELESRRHGMLLNGTDADVEKLDGQIKAAQREVERQHAAIGELTALLSDAEAAEKVAETEAQAATARRALDEWLRLAVELDEDAVKMCEKIEACIAARQTIHTANKLVRERGRDDLRCPYPEVHLAEHLKLSSALKVPQIGNWQLHGYRNLIDHGFGDVSIRTVPDNPRHLARARELLADRFDRPSRGAS